jgi:hypothetical protein
MHGVDEKWADNLGWKDLKENHSGEIGVNESIILK